MSRIFVLFVVMCGFSLSTACTDSTQKGKRQVSFKAQNANLADSGDATKGDLTETKVGAEPTGKITEKKLSDIEPDGEGLDSLSDLTLDDAASDFIETKGAENVQKMDDEAKLQEFKDHVMESDQLKKFADEKDADILDAIKKAIGNPMTGKTLKCEKEGEYLVAVNWDTGEVQCEKIAPLVINKTVNNNHTVTEEKKPEPPKPVVHEFTTTSGKRYCNASGTGGIAAIKTFEDGNCRDGFGGDRCRCKLVETARTYETCVKIEEQRNDRVEAGSCGMVKLGSGQWQLNSNSHDHSNKQRLLCRFRCTGKQ